jgi:Fic-DOC domain mobile mystery protein B
MHVALPGATPLEPDEREGLIPGHIATREQLNEWEHENIVQGTQWAFARKREDLLTTAFMKQLHRRMFSDTWRWAGSLRLSEKNIGVVPEQIAVELLMLCDDIRAQLAAEDPDVPRLAARFHHRLVKIHPFPNGNGRFSRVMADLLLAEHGREPFAWGETALTTAGEVRDTYIAALRQADGNNYNPLFEFLLVGG